MASRGFVRRLVRGLPAWLAAAPLLGCGARSGLDAAGFVGSIDGGAIDGSAAADAGAAPDAGPTGDRCPSAVSGPTPMAGSCSTRDGRSRVPAPTAPHVTWKTRLPTDSTGRVGPSAIATDASGHAYVVTTGEIDESTAALRRVSAADGTVDWTTAISPDEETSTPIVLSRGGVDLFAYGTSYADAVFTFEPSSGASTSTTFGFSLYYAPRDLAVGADGSLYVTHEDRVGEANPTSFISRVAPDGTVLWTSVDLKTLGPAPMYGDVSPSTVALGQGDLVVIVVGVLTKAQEVSVASAFDPATGAVRWSTTLPGPIVGGPVVRSDGTIVALLDMSGGVTALAELDPRSGAPTTHRLSSGAFEIYGVTERGIVIAGGDTGNGVTGIVAVGQDGAMLWTSPGPSHATIAANGMIVAFGPEITAIDERTGATKWRLAPAVAGSCVADAALTSAGGIVALQCDGTLFGASD